MVFSVEQGPVSICTNFNPTMYNYSPAQYNVQQNYLYIYTYTYTLPNLSAAAVKIWE